LYFIIQKTKIQKNKNTKIQKYKKMKDFRINKFSIILFIIVITFIIIYNTSHKSPFKRRRSIPSIYYDGNIYSIYGSVGNPYTLRGNQGSSELHPFQGDQNLFVAPNANMLLYGQNAPYVNNNFNSYNPSASMIYNSL
jgi:hypothetical protein